MSNHPSRKPNRLPGYDYTQNGAYSVTICTKDRSPILWNDRRGGNLPPAETDYLSDTGKIVETAIRQISLVYPSVYVDRYCIMPDHVHLILRIQSSDTDGRQVAAPTVSTVVGNMKRWVSKQAGNPIWQKSFYDHVIRDERDYIETVQYIDNNLIRQVHHIPKGM